MISKTVGLGLPVMRSPSWATAPKARSPCRLV